MNAICAYSMSGQYGPIARYVNYSFLLVSIIFHRHKKIVSGALGAAMLFSAISAIHGIALASARGRGTVDLDIIPVFAITGVGMMVGAPLLAWSKTLKEAPRSLRLVLFVWIALMFAGAMASVASLRALPKPVACGIGPMCGLTCTTTLPMRKGQAITAVSFGWRNLLDRWTISFAFLGPIFAFFGVLFAVFRPHPRKMVQQMMYDVDMSCHLRTRSCCTVVMPILSAGLAVVQIVIMEIMLMGPHGLPFDESLTAIGQWSTLVGIALALMASAIQWAFSE